MNRKVASKIDKVWSRQHHRCRPLRSNGALIQSNDDWKQSQSAGIQASGLAPADDREAAIIGNFLPGTYTAVLRGNNGSSGLGLVKTYKLN